MRRIMIMALPMSIGSLWLFGQYWPTDINKALTMSLTALAVFQWFNAWNCRHESKSVFQLYPLANKFLVGATLIVIGLQMLAIYHPLMQKVLHTQPLSLSDWLIIMPLAASIIAVEELRKFFYRWRLKVYN